MGKKGCEFDKCASLILSSERSSVNLEIRLLLAIWRGLLLSLVYHLVPVKLIISLVFNVTTNV